MRMIKWIKSLDQINVKEANKGALEKRRNIEKDVEHKVEMEGDYIIEYDLVKTREIITYFDNSIKECPWDEPKRINVIKKLNEELINKREEERKERERKEKLKREKEEENERKKREEENLRRRIESVNVSNYYKRPEYHHRSNLSVSFPVYRHDFAGGRLSFCFKW